MACAVVVADAVLARAGEHGDGAAGQGDDAALVSTSPWRANISSTSTEPRANTSTGSSPLSQASAPKSWMHVPEDRSGLGR